MRVQVTLRREGGAYRQPYGKGATATGQLSITHRDAGGRKVPVLQLYGAGRQWPALFDPRLVSWADNEFKILGYERMDRAWVLQEWDCEVL